MKKIFTLVLLMVAPVLFTLNGAIAQDSEDRFNFETEPQKATRERNNYDWNPNRESIQKKNNRNIFSKKDFGFMLGLNTFDKAIDMPELNDWQSRYVALQWRKNHKIITGRHIDVALGTGLEVAWNNFMMKYDERYFQNGSVSDFQLVESQLHKSKLVVNTLNLPLMLQFGFKESDFRIGIGAYAGVRINSYQRFEDLSGNSVKEKASYNLRQWNYGLMAEAGKKGLKLFAKYDMNPLFNSSNPINANVLSFGLRL